jgi:hypothetical protein
MTFPANLCAVGKAAHWRLIERETASAPPMERPPYRGTTRVVTT